MVLQFEATSKGQFAELRSLTYEKVGPAVNALPETTLDGHDFGLGEFNIFIHTDDPEAALDSAGEAISSAHPELAFAAGYRSFAADEYIPLWPTSLQTFAVA